MKSVLFNDDMRFLKKNKVSMNRSKKATANMAKLVHMPYKQKLIPYYKRIWRSIKSPDNIGRRTDIRLPVSFVLMNLLAENDTRMGLERRLTSGIGLHLLLSEVTLPREIVKRVHLDQNSLEELKMLILQINRTRIIQMSQKMSAMENLLLAGDDLLTSQLIVIDWNKASRAVILDQIGEIMKNHFLLSLDIERYRSNGSRKVLINLACVNLPKLGIVTIYPSLWEGNLQCGRIKTI